MGDITVRSLSDHSTNTGMTAAIGSNALALPWAVAQLGWVAGPIVMLLFAFVTYYTSTVVAECSGQQRSHNLASKFLFSGGCLFFIQLLNLYDQAIGYMAAAANSMRASKCFRTNPRKTAYIITFGSVAMFLTQIAVFDQIKWLSSIPALMFFVHTSVGLGRGIALLIENGTLEGSMYETVDNLNTTRAAQAWSILEALAGMVLAYSCTKDVIRIQDTEQRESNRANLTLAIVVTVFNLLCSCVTYAAFGHDTPKNLYTGSGFNEPIWLIHIANAAIAIQMLVSYQICTQPLFAFVEKKASEAFPDSSFITNKIKLSIPGLKSYELSPFKVLWRSAFVITTMATAILLPFINSVFEIVGVFMFWPLSVYLPVEAHISQHELPKWSHKWVCLKIMSLVLLLVSVAALVGSVAGAIHEINNYKPFAMDY